MNCYLGPNALSSPIAMGTRAMQNHKTGELELRPATRIQAPKPTIPAEIAKASALFTGRSTSKAAGEGEPGRITVNPRPSKIGSSEEPVLKLADVGIDKNLSARSQCQPLARLSQIAG